MAGLSSRSVSLSDHVKRRRSSALLSSHGSRGSAMSSHDGSGSSGGSASRSRGRPQHLLDPPPSRPIEGGYDSHAASYGNYDAPSAHCRSYGASEVGCYGAERYIGGGYRSRSPVEPRRGSYSEADMDIDIEGQRCEQGSSRRPRRSGQYRQECADAGLRISQASTLPTRPNERSSWEEESYSYYSSRGQDSCCPSMVTASTASSSLSTIGGPVGEEDAIRRGIVDLSTLIATYIAGALSFVIGIFLALASPFVKVIKVIVGDVRGLLGDATFLQELGSLWRMYRELRRRSAASASDEENCHRRYPERRRHYDDESTEANSTVYTEASAQYVGGWRPTVAPSVGSAGSHTASTGDSSSWHPSVSPRRPMGGSRSHSSLPLVHEGRSRDRYQGQGPPTGSPMKGQSRRQSDYTYYDHPTPPPPATYHPPQSRSMPPQMPRQCSMEYDRRGEEAIKGVLGSHNGHRRNETSDGHYDEHFPKSNGAVVELPGVVEN